MNHASFDGPMGRRSRKFGRRRDRTQRPAVESMEGRQLLSGTPYALITHNPVVTEGTGGTTVANFPILLTSPAGAGGAFINYQTFNSSALAGQDYTATSGVLRIAPGQLTGTIPVAVTPDSTVEPTETFGLRLSGAGGALVITPVSYATILDDDAAVAPELSIADATVTRGATDTETTLSFQVELNATQSESVSVRATTGNLTALAGLDYQAKSQVLTFQPGERVKQFQVTVYGSSTELNDKLMLVTLSETDATLDRSTGAGVIRATA